MEVIKYFKNIFSSDNISANISLFSILGVTAILFSNVADLYTSETYFGYPPTAYWELIIDIAVVFLLSFVFKGYVYTYAHELFKDEKTSLPDLNFSSLTSFLKMLPLFVIWFAYVALLIILGTRLFSMFNFWAYCYYGLVFCLVPFIGVVLAMYAKEFNFKYSILNPLPLFLAIRKGFVPVLVFLLELVPFLIGVSFVFDKGFEYTRYLANTPALQLAIRLILLSFCAYVSGVFSLVYVQGFVKIAKEKVFTE